MDMQPPPPPNSGLRRRRRYSARPFALTLLVISIISLLAWAKNGQLHATGKASGTSGTSPAKRDLMSEDLECHLVHRAADQCAFVLANCPDEEAGIFSYLSLYYCRLPHAKPVAFVILVLWLALLFSTIGIAASDFFCVNLSTIANLLGMSESMAGVTFLAFGNGSPDVFSTFAAFNTHSASLAIGELVGAACFITAVVAGSMAIVRPFKVARKSFIRDVGFFIVAACFSMLFIWDGKLSLWESATMVGFYIFYVGFVMVWHWWLGRRKARRLRAATMRSHYVFPGGEEEEIPQEYFDDEDGPAAEGRNSVRGPSTDDFDALERAGSGGGSLEEDENEQARDRWLGELNDNMRVRRPTLGSRRNTHTPIRPSLVGALEFRAVLSALQKSRNITSMPISLRRYSDDPTFTSAQQQDLISTTTDPAPRPPYDIVPDATDRSPLLYRPSIDAHRQMGNRIRAVSTNDMERTRHDPESILTTAIPSIDFAPPSPELERSRLMDTQRPPPSPTISLSPPPSERGSRPTTPNPATVRHPSPDRLAPPDNDGYGGSQPARQGTASPSPFSSPVPGASRASSQRKLKLTVPGASSPPIPFPVYTDYPFSAHSSSRAPSLRLPSPSASPESLFPVDPFHAARDTLKPPRWWPSRLLPAPRVLLSTLFPTLDNWNEKNIWEKMLGVVAAPSVFLLTITLPVVESQKDDDSDDGLLSPSITLPGSLTPVPGGSHHHHQQSIISLLEPGSPSGIVPPKHKPSATVSKPGSTHARSTSAASASAGQPPQLSIITEDNIMHSPEQIPSDPKPSEPKSWNRWLVILQAFTAPFFIVLIVWANTEVEYPRALIRPTLYSLLFSLCILAVLLTTTTPTRPPRWRTVLCFLGFVVSIAWISSIANEVVGVLKTLGVILNMSDAILGLTIFAVGNSLGDLVADITVARLGFPIMALSACFGGPMLNILLGIGISGCYITIKGERKSHAKHPDRPIRFKPYHIDVSTTLVISGATLLVTLAGLLVAVPWRKWKMDKTIGWGLVALWTFSTLANVMVEVLGYSSEIS
ncbi:sodium/calcium exchanger protein-like protein [Corynespora cassiicola Philippines]|uniref:Sodium/calcium exchanger protein-like protein n=1 Tax=Corynespora cassiicola Philippines TaxID=1448308 RepID=A0A2T2NI05_CORCC|nr:sodium/calcium exchanger protein-like protein [Corynespora cassiicola Philippines]